MVLAPNVRLIKLALAALVGAVVVIAGVVALAAPAGAQTGARGTAYHRSVEAVGHGAARRQRLVVGGYALNPATQPSQAVKAVVYGETRRGGPRHRLYTSGAHLADGSRYDATDAAQRLPKDDRGYTFAWTSAPFDATDGAGHEYGRLLVCVYAHDDGSRGAYTKIDKCRPTAQSGRSGS